MLAEQKADLDKKARLFTAMEENGEDVTDLKEMNDLLLRMHGIAERRLRATKGKADNT